MPKRRLKAGRGGPGAVLSPGARLPLAIAILVGLFGAPAALMPGGPLPASISAEAVAAVALVALWPDSRWPKGLGIRYPAAGLLLILLALHVLSLATEATLGRPFLLAFDVPLLRAAMDFAVETYGALLSAFAGGVILAVLIAAFALVLFCLRTVQTAARQSAAARAFAVLGCGAVLVLQTGHWVAPGRITLDLVSQGRALAARLGDQAIYHRAAVAAPLTQGPTLANGLRGADVLLFVLESYGRSAIEDPRYRDAMVPSLHGVEAALRAQGLAAVSGWLESPTFGGQSWLAHASLLSGLWVDNQFRYDLLLSGRRRTLVDDFKVAGYRTVLLEPAIDRPWPQAAFYGFDRTYFARDMGYRGPRYGWVTMPDQYSLAFLDRTERQKDRTGQPLLAVTVLISSHAPWTPVAEVVQDWTAIGDGRLFATWADRGEPAQILWRDAGKVRRQYARAMRYVIDVFASYFRRFGNRPTLVILVGDHQPAPIVSGSDRRHDVPIHVISNDAALLRPFRAWGLVDGMVPARKPASLRMDAFREAFLRSFGSEGKAPAAIGADDRPYRRPSP